MKKWQLYMVIFALIGVIILMHNCEPETMEIIIPEIEGEFKPQIPSHKPEIDTFYITKWEQVEVKTKNPVNDSLAKAYQQVRDSIEMYKMYLYAIEIRDFRTTFEDSLVKIDISGKVQGEVKSIFPSYKLKERKIKTKQPPEPIFTLFLGGKFGAKTSFEGNMYEGNIAGQFRSKAILGFGYSRIRKEEYFTIQYLHPIFTIKK